MKPNIKPGDVHVVISDFEDPEKFVGQAKCFDHTGKLMWTIDALCKGATPDYSIRNGDTPPGLYKIGIVTETQSWENGATWASFGRWFLDLVGLENNEERFGRGGCGVHGGGSALPNPLISRQKLIPTHGCVRVHNEDLDKLVVPTVKKVQKDGGIVYVSIHQF